MEKQLSYYDLVGSIAPGAVLWVAAAMLASILSYRPTFQVGGVAALGLGLVLVYVLGQLLQAVASIIEPVYFRVWGGMPSEQLLAGKSKRMSKTHLDALASTVGARLQLESPLATESDRRTFFRLCTSLGHEEKSGRLQQFQGSYALHRGLLTAGLLALVGASVVAAMHVRFALHLRPAAMSDLYVTLAIAVVLSAIEIYRARQRAYYLALQVLDAALIVATQKPTASTEQASSEEDLW